MGGYHGAIDGLLAEAGIFFYFPQGPEVDASAVADALVDDVLAVYRADNVKAREQVEQVE